MSAPVIRFGHHLQEPIVTNRGLDLLAALSWLSLAWWGIFSLIEPLPSVSQATTSSYSVFWGLFIGIPALVASAAALSTFFTIPRVSRVVKRGVELASVVLLAGFISVYPAIIIAGAFAGQPARLAVIGVAVGYVFLPVWRIIHLSCRIKALRQMPPSYDNG